MIAAFDAGDVDRARAINDELLPVIRGDHDPDAGRDRWPRRRCSCRVARAAVRCGCRCVDATEAELDAAARRPAPPAASPGFAAHEPPAPELGPPAAAARRARLRVVALGGLGEIGRNMTVFEYAGRLLDRRLRRAVPRGRPARRRPDPARLRLHPRTGSTTSRRSCSPTAHEDHIGAVPYLLRERPDIPLVGSRLTLALVEAKLREHRIKPYTLEVARGPGRAARPVRAASSSRSTTRSRTRSRSRSAPPPGTVLHTGDFKMDQLPLDGRLTDLRAFARLGRGGRRPVPGRLDQRRGARVRHDRARDRAGARPRSSPARERRVIVASLRLARAPGPAGPRRRARARPQGRLRRPVDGAQHGRRPRPRLPARSRPDVVVDPGRARRRCPTTQVVLISTGSQGEPMSALSRMANRDHQHPDRRGRHGAARVLADPRQRERGLPRHQRADPARREGRAQGQRAGARLRPRRRRRAARTATTSSGRATSCPCTASGGTCAPTPSSRC